MAENPWKLFVDGYLNVGTDSECIIYHPTLNVIVILTKSRYAYVLDVNSGAILHKSSLSAKSLGKLQAVYLPGCDKVLFSDGKGIGVRRDHNGVLLLDTILQAPLSRPDETVKLDLLFSDALVLQNSLTNAELSVVDQTAAVLKELNERIKEAQSEPRKGTKAHKWNTICLELPHQDAKMVFAALVQELKRQNRYIPALSVASAMHERLNCLLPSCATECPLTDRASMFSEAVRRATFVKWPHMNYKWALPDQMAQAGFYHQPNSAGFYHQPNSTGDDRAMCFTCHVCLVCWEPTDEPWSEHERHSPACPFVKGEFTQNVPLSVTYATSPATLFDTQGEQVDIIATSSVPELVATASHSGLVALWNVMKQLKEEVRFCISLPDLGRLQPTESFSYSDINLRETSIRKSDTASGFDVEADILDSQAGSQFLELTACSIVGGPHQKKPEVPQKKSTNIASTSNSLRPCVIGGVLASSALSSNLKTDLNYTQGSRSVSSLKMHVKDDMNMDSNSECTLGDTKHITKVFSCVGNEKSVDSMYKATTVDKYIYLIVYDFHYQSPLKNDYIEIKENSGGLVHHGQPGNTTKKSVSGTGTSASSGTKQENNMYQEIFFSKFLYDVPVTEEVEAELMSPPQTSLPPPPPPPPGVEYHPSSGAFYQSGGGVGSTSGSTSVSGIPEASSFNTKFLSLSGDMYAMKLPSCSDDSPPPLIEAHHESSRDISMNLKTKEKNPAVVQCFPLPEAYQCRDMFILGVYPTHDGGHLLIVLGSLNCDNDNASDVNVVNDISVSDIGNGISDFSGERNSVGGSCQRKTGTPVTTSKPSQKCQLPKKCVAFTSKGILREKYSSKFSNSDCICSAVLIYSLDLKSEVVKVDEVPLLARHFNLYGECPVEVTLLPLLEKDDHGENAGLLYPEKGSPSGLAALVCRDGSVRIIELKTLKIVSTAVPEKRNTKFISAAYCNSLERLCMCTDNGSLHFFMMTDEQEPDDDDDDLALRGSESSMQPLGQPGSLGAEIYLPDVDLAEFQGSPPFGLPSEIGSISNFSNERLLVNKPSFGISDLQTFFELTKYENLSPVYAATVPPCWVEIMQAQKQRRHPQHLQQVDDHTRSWRLQSDDNTWDEHVFEITLPRSCCIGHVDLKFSLHSPCNVFPHIHVTLLKLNANGIGKKERISGAKLLDSGSKGVKECTTDESNQNTNTDVLCGPVYLASRIDLTDTGGSVTLTSPKLHRMRGRTLLVRLKAAAVNGGDQKSQNQERGSTSKRSKFEHGGGRLMEWMIEYLYSRDNLLKQNRKLEFSAGCDWLTEVSITIRRTKPTTIPNERVQRCLMLESNSFVEKLLHVIFLQGSDKTKMAQSMALDILLWIASIRLSSPGTTEEEQKTLQISFIHVIEINLSPLIKYCLLMSGRSIAYKCVKLITICSEGMRTLLDTAAIPFDRSVLQNLVEWLPKVPCCVSAGALHWYFLLLSRVLSVDTSAVASLACATLLQQVANEMSNRCNLYHQLLKARFGLYNMPLEPELFDIELPIPAKFTSVPVTYSTVSNEASGSGSAVGSAFGQPVNSTGQSTSDTIELKDFLPGAIGGGMSSDSKGNTLRIRRLLSNNFMKGLLEVEPLHFKCHTASDGTKMERIEPGSPLAANSSVPMGNVFESNFIISSSSGSKKADISFYGAMKMEDPFSDVMKDTTILNIENGTCSSDDTKKDENCLFNDIPLNHLLFQAEQEESKKVDGNSGALPWQQLLAMPPQHMLVIERMHSGARRFVVLDFGSPILLTDLFIPTCSDLVSVSIDIWCEREELDGQRLVVAADIGSKSLVMNDIQPPPVCRYLKITAIGRYGMSTTKCKIPIGSFYGHVVILPGEDYAESSEVPVLSEHNIQAQLAVLAALFEDIHCRYSLSCAKLQEFLDPFLSSEMPNVMHMHDYFRRAKEIEKFFPSALKARIMSAYSECVTFQYQLNLVRNVVHRLESAQGKITHLPEKGDTEVLLADACTDKLRVLEDRLLDILLYIVYELGPVPRMTVSLYEKFDQTVCEQLFHSLCVNEDTRMQLSACTLLVRMGGLQPWWGDFLATMLNNLFSSQYNEIFPQDRVFVLLTYMARKSLASGAPCSLVLENVLRMLGGLLSPLASRDIAYLKAEMDFYQIEWVLLFLSACLDTGGHFIQSCEEEKQKPAKDRDQGFIASRWDFIHGEIAIQRRLANSIRNCSSRGIRRKIQKWILHRKQQLEELATNRKAAHTSAKSGADVLRTYHEGTTFQKPGYPYRAPSSAQKGKDEPDPEKDLIVSLPPVESLPVAKALIEFLLKMDFTCNIDLFLLTCKVVARIVASIRPAVTLGDLMTENQLLHLVRLAVWNDQHKVNWGGPWASHAIYCLLQDILDVARQCADSDDYSSHDSLPTSGQSSLDTAINEPTEEDVKVEDTVDSSIGGSAAVKSNGFVLPSLLESEDSDIEDILDDILEAKHTHHKKGLLNKMATSCASSISTALDARLEFGVTWDADVILRRLSMAGAYNLPVSVTCSIPPLPDNAKQSAGTLWDDGPLRFWQSRHVSTMDTVEMLSHCFDRMFMGLSIHHSWTNLELILHLWLTLNSQSTGDPGAENTYHFSLLPCISLTPPAISKLIAVLALHPGISLRAWCLAFQCLTALTCAPCVESGSADSSSTWSSETGEDMELSVAGTARTIIEDKYFTQMLLRFLSGSGLNTRTSTDRAGPSACQSLHNLLIRLQMRSDFVATNSRHGNPMILKLLQVVHQLVQTTGAVSCHQGPLDAQCKLVDLLLKLYFTNIDLGTAMSIIECVGLLVYTHLYSFEYVQCRSGSDVAVDASTCFSGILGSSLGNESMPQNSSWEYLLCNLLRLAIKLVQTHLALQVFKRDNSGMNLDVIDWQIPSHGSRGTQLEKRDDICLTDEHKVAEQQISSEGSRQYLAPRPELKIPCIADTVLQHLPTMLRLFNALTGCSASTLALLLSSAAPTEKIIIDALGDVGDSVTIGDCVFRLVLTLHQKSSTPDLILCALFHFLHTESSSESPTGPVGVLQLSEPLLWLLLQVLSSEYSLEQFNRMGGMKVIGDNLIKSNLALINSHPSLVSVLIQHFSSIPPGLTLHNTRNSPIETVEGLMNFAPLGTITSSNPTAQPAEVLIHSAPPHRRARAPAWTYHFYPNEVSMDFTLTLPCAVLLKEIHLQPHLTSLATSPSAVAVEVSRDNSSGLIPLSPPVSTSGLTFIRLQLPDPEIVTSVLLRLYKPRDSSNIGLSQIRLLGLTAFGETINKQNNCKIPLEDLFSKSSLGWLRMLHHCLHFPLSNSALASSLLTSAASVNGLLEACCGLFLIPAPAAFTYMRKLEEILLKLGLHVPELGLKEINILLRKGPATFAQSTWPTSMTETSSSPAIDSVVDLIFRLCAHQDEFTKDRVRAVLSWLHEVADNATQQLAWNFAFVCPSSAYIHNIAAILWRGKANAVNYNLSSLITVDLFKLLYSWTLDLSPNSALKKAIDGVLCSMCYIKPTIFPTLLQRMDVLVFNLAIHRSASISDDRKDQEPGKLAASITDDSKKLVIGGEQSCEVSEWYNHLVIQDVNNLHLNENQLGTLALVCQSPPAIRQLLDSGLPSLLSQCIVEFCKRQMFSESQQSHINVNDQEGKATVPNRILDPPPMVKIEIVPMILNFFAEVCAEGVMRDWLGSTEGSVFWSPLLSLLCSQKMSDSYIGSNKSKCEVSSDSYSALESATVRFLSRCCCCHPANQQLLSEVLSVVISQQKNVQQNVGFLHGISGFTRRLVLQLLLENEKLFVCLNANFPMDRCSIEISYLSSSHPRYGSGLQHQLQYVSTQKTCGDIARSLTDITLPTSSIEAVIPSLPSFQLVLQHSAWPDVCLPSQMTLAQLLSILHDQGHSLSTPCLSFTVVKQAISVGRENRETLDSEIEHFLSSSELPTPLQVFTEAGGLALLARHLPLVYPETLRYSAPDKASSPDTYDGDWVKVEANEEIYEDMDESLLTGSSSPGGGIRGTPLPPVAVPPHSLAAFGLFLRLPGYAEVLLKEKKRAQCLLRLVLGVTDDGEGGDIFSSPAANSLHTLPFQVLQQLFDSTPHTTDDGVLLRRTTIEIGAMHLLLGCLSVFTHQSQDISLPGGQHELLFVATKATLSSQENRRKSDDKSHLYWAKGTGFGTGSTAQSWNVEQALLRQRSEEEQVTVLLQVLSSFISPCRAMPCLPDDMAQTVHESVDENETSYEQAQLPPVFHDLLRQSCLLPAVCSYLRNDSVLDMSRHVPLYLAVLELLRAMALSTQLVPLLLSQDKREKSDARDELSVVGLLSKMKDCVNTYSSRLKNEKNDKTGKGNGKQASGRNKEEIEQDEGLACLIPDIQRTAAIVEDVTHKLQLQNKADSNLQKHASSSCGIQSPLRWSREEKYMEIMKALQFDTFEMITECGEDGFQFVVSYRFEANMRSAGERSHPSRMKRLAQETVTLSSSLPLSYSSSVFVRCDADRLDIMKVLITGPAETPYANGCFEFDVYFPPDYPNSPMLINLETTGHHTVRFNPNLYNDGRVCLSVLNTWHGRPEEKWNAQTSSFLQVLVSIQSLILVPEPYFNEPGYERSRGTPNGDQSSREYNSNICQSTVRWAMLEQVRRPCPCFKEVIHTHFWFKKKEIIKQVENWLADMKKQTSDRRTGRIISFNALALERYLDELREELYSLKTPKGLEDFQDPDTDFTSVPSSIHKETNEPNSKSKLGATSHNEIPTVSSAGQTTHHEHSMQVIVSHQNDTEKLVSNVCGSV